MRMEAYFKKLIYKFSKDCSIKFSFKNSLNKIKINKPMLKLTRHQRDLILGVILGDGHLCTKTNGRSYTLMIEQSFKKHGDYALHLYDILKPIVSTPPKLVKTDPIKGYENISFRTITHPALRFYGKLFYKNKKKTLPKNVHKYLNPRVLAYWYMDDGARKGKNRPGKRLHTEGYPQIDVKRLCCALNFLGIETTINRQNRTMKDGTKKTYFLLNITAKGDKVFTDMIKPYVIQSMFYKL